MTAEACREVRDLAPESVLGIASGDERARVLRHTTECPACRAFVQEMALVADELMLAARPQEPPAGFEGRALAALDPAPPRRRVAMALGAAAALLVVAIGGTLFATREDRDIGAYYRAMLAETNGEYFSAALLHDDTGSDRGVVYGYAGQPAWVLVVLRDLEAGGSYEVVAMTEEGRRVELGAASLGSGDRVWSSELPMELHDVMVFRLESSSGDLVGEMGD